jgi:glycine oxidase
VKNWDVIIIGAGIIGLSLARELRKRATVLVIDRGMPGREASHAAAGMLAATPGEVPGLLLELASASLQLYPEFVHELQDESGIDVDFRDAGTMLFSDSLASSSSVISSQRMLELEPNIEAQGRRNAAMLSEASVDPRALVSAVLQACKHRGVDTSFGNAVESLKIEHGRVVGVRTAKTEFSAPIVVNSAGAWAGQISPGSLPTRPVKGQMLSVAMPTRDLIRHVIRTPDVYLVPRTDGRLLIGATLEDAGYDKRVDADTIHRLHRAALALVPALNGARILEDWAGLRPGTPDSLPILGAMPIPGYFVATGHYRDGILLTPVTARAMAQVICAEKCAYDLSAFSPDRFPADSAA